MLQAKQGKTKDYFMQSAKLTKANGEPLAALHELESSMKLLSLMEDDSQVLDLTVDNNEETNMIKAKVRITDVVIHIKLDCRDNHRPVFYELAG